jgi:hypothetical protein
MGNQYFIQLIKTSPPINDVTDHFEIPELHSLKLNA